MKTTLRLLAASLCAISLSAAAQDISLQAIPPFLNTPSIQAQSTDEAAQMLETIEALPTIPATEESSNGWAVTYYSASHLDWPPYPANIQAFDGWPLDDTGNAFLLNDFDIGDGGGSHSMADEPFPSGFGDGDTNDLGSGFESFFLSQIFTTNNLWLQITGVTTGTTSSYLVIYPAWNDTNGIWDVFGTTNIMRSAPDLNSTNWAWVLRTSLWQTNLTVLNFSISGQSYFLLGTLLDSDGDGLTDAYEKLVSHTNPNNADTDNDGIPDYWEVLLGLNPNVSDNAQPTSRLNYTYDLASRLKEISGVKTGSITLDAEGNVLSVSQ